MLKCDTYIITKFTIKFKRNFKMNKGLHRIIFNKKHGTMVAVAENLTVKERDDRQGPPLVILFQMTLMFLLGLLSRLLLRL